MTAKPLPGAASPVIETQPNNGQPDLDRHNFAEARTPLLSFYGNYKVVEVDGKPFAEKHVPATALTCDSQAQLGNANLKRKFENAGSRGVQSVVNTSYDAETKALIPADQLWLSVGLTFVRVPACEEMSIFVFADRGQWKSGPSSLTYEFDDTVLNRNLDGSFSESKMKLQVELKKREDGKIAIEIFSEKSGTAFRKTFVLEKLQ